MLERLDIVGDVDVVCLLASQLECICTLTREKLQRYDSHTDQVWAVNPLKRFSYHSLDSLHQIFTFLTFASKLNRLPWDKNKLISNLYRIVLDYCLFNFEINFWQNLQVGKALWQPNLWMIHIRTLCLQLLWEASWTGCSVLQRQTHPTENINLLVESIILITKVSWRPFRYLDYLQLGLYPEKLKLWRKCNSFFKPVFFCINRC